MSSQFSPSRPPTTCHEPPARQPVTFRAAHLGFALAAVWVAVVFVLVSAGA